jgi:sugar/nucleoside kinase (ribokinase family)
LASLEAEGIDCSGVAVSEHAASGIAMVVVDEAGNNSIITGQSSNGDLTPELVARNLQMLTVARMIVCDFPAAAVTALDTTGAGDTFAGAFATAIVAGASGPRGVAFAQAAAATCITRAGAAPSIPYLHEIGVEF